MNMYDQRLVLILDNLSSSLSEVHQASLSGQLCNVVGLDYVCRRQEAVCLGRGWCNENRLPLASWFGIRQVFIREVTCWPRVPVWPCAFVFECIACEPETSLDQLLHEMLVQLSLISSHVVFDRCSVDGRCLLWSVILCEVRGPGFGKLFTYCQILLAKLAYFCRIL